MNTEQKTSTKRCPHCSTDIPSEAKKCPQCHTDLRDWFRRHPIISFVIIFFAGLILLGGIIGSFEETTIDTKNSNTSVIPKDPEKLEADKKRLEELKNNFEYKYDEFENKGWYTHKNQILKSSYNRPLLKVLVNNAGYSYLESQYYGDNWLFHTRVEVKIAETVLKSDTIEGFQDENSRNNNGGKVWEIISYTRYRDNGIIAAIASAGENPVKVRFAGGDSIKDITLSKKDQEAIRDSYELAQLIKETSN